MSNAWFLYLGPLAIAFIFIVVAVVMLRSAIRGGQDSDGKRHAIAKGCLGVIFGAVGTAVSFGILFFAPSPWERESLFEQVFRTPPENIRRFVILPGSENENHPPTAIEVVIEDREHIERIARILETSQEIAPNHPRSKWTAVVEMTTDRGTYYFSVRAPEPGDLNGTLVSVKLTKDADGWNLGDVRAEGLERLLENAAEEARRR